VPVPELIFNTLPCNPAEDIDSDFGSLAYVTGNTGGAAEDDDVENGYTLLSSPLMDFTTMHAPTLAFTPWLCEQFIEYPAYYVLLSNGSDTVHVDTISTIVLGGFWQEEREIVLTGSIEFTDQMQVHFLVEDVAKVDNIVKGAVDKVLVYDAMPSAVADISNRYGQLLVYPNPANGVFNVEYEVESGSADKIAIYNVLGQKVYEVPVPGNAFSIDVSSVAEAGMYMVQLIGEGKVLGVGKIVLE
jgi:hypothetical protein